MKQLFAFLAACALVLVIAIPDAPAYVNLNKTNPNSYLQWFGVKADQSFIGSSILTDKPTAGVVIGAVYIDTTSTLSYYWSGSGWKLRAVAAKSDTSRLEAPGAFKAIGCAGFGQIAVYVQNTNFATSGTYKMQAKANHSALSLNNGWASVSDTLVYSGNDIWCWTYAYPATADSFRCYFWSEAGGTGGTPFVLYKLANPQK